MLHEDDDIIPLPAAPASSFACCIESYSDLYEAAFEDFVGTPLVEEEKFRRLGMPLPLRIKLRKLHAAEAVQGQSARPDPLEV